jgi:methylenetetrahydrofolate dehydrogenase (NADP+) / methenyltetrahydrofolate cyclohydrolase
MKIIDGKALAEKINDNTVGEILEIGHRPNLAIILVGNNPDSEIYVNKKIETGRKVGIEPHLYKCVEDIGQEKILEMIKFLNDDPEIDGIMVQLPLPRDKGYDTDAVIAAIDPEKDVDRFHAKNVEAITSSCDPEMILPPVYGVILEMLKSIGCEISGKKVTVLANSDIFGGNLKKILECRGAETIVCRADDPELVSKTKNADILIPVIGRPKFVKKEMIKDGAVIIDVGITRELGSIYGDVDFEDVKDIDGYISPVPGGVGPVTVAITLRNTLELYKKNHDK